MNQEPTVQEIEDLAIAMHAEIACLRGEDATARWNKLGEEAGRGEYRRMARLAILRLRPATPETLTRSAEERAWDNWACGARNWHSPMDLAHQAFCAGWRSSQLD